MKIYMAVDLEGITGVVGSWQCSPLTGAPPDIRRLVAADVNAAIAGAKRGGADVIWVNENHTGREMLLEDLDPDAEVLIGKPKPLNALSGLDATFGCLFLVGIHAAAATEAAVLDHTWTPKCIQSLRVNGTVFGEVGLNAMVAGHFGVPVALVTGDEAVAKEAQALLGDIECAVVKFGLDRYSARCLSPAKARAVIETCAERAVREIGRFKPLRVDTPVRVEVEYANSAYATRALWIPTIERVDPIRVAFSAPDAVAAMRTFSAAAALAKAIDDPVY